MSGVEVEVEIWYLKLEAGVLCEEFRYSLNKKMNVVQT